MITYRIVWDAKAQKMAKRWKKSNPRSFDKLTQILHELMVHPYFGTGHPEPLRAGRNCVYSRRISANDRLIYTIDETTISVFIVQLGGHYDDK